jgi:antitoxin (DNA-binding transcriptional repressor) of toxin-antitoxin stability system
MSDVVISATTLARQVGDLLGRIRYRGESFVIERNGVVVARLGPAGPAGPEPLAAALRAWIDAGDPDPEFADTLDQVNAADRIPDNPWES